MIDILSRKMQAKKESVDSRYKNVLLNTNIMKLMGGWFRVLS